MPFLTESDGWHVSNFTIFSITSKTDNYMCETSWLLRTPCFEVTGVIENGFVYRIGYVGI